jgi:hypothetical protein
MRFVVDRMPLGQVSSRIHMLYSVKAIQPMHHTLLHHNILLSEGQEGQAWEPANIAVFFGLSKSTGLTSISALSQLVQDSGG